MNPATHKIQSNQLEIQAVDHCNLSCASCDKFSPVSPRYAEPLASLIPAMRSLSRVYHVKTLRVMGGEPTLRADLEALLAEARSTGISDSIRVVSNGTLPETFTPAVLSKIDSVELSLYPGFTWPVRELHEFKARLKQHGVKLFLRDTRGFVMAYSERGARDPGLVERLYRTCKSAHQWRCQGLYAGHFFKCSRSLNIDRLLRHDPDFSSGVRITEEDGLLNQLTSYLGDAKNPLPACTFCLGVAGKMITHSQVPRSKWRDAHAGWSEELVDHEALAAHEQNREYGASCLNTDIVSEGFAVDWGYDGSEYYGTL